MARLITLKNKTRDGLAQEILGAINQVGEDNVIGITMSGAADGKFGGGGLLANYVAYVFVKG